MLALTRAGMKAGAIGLSSGPYYAPGSYAKTDELVALAKVAAEFGGVYSSHIRDESDYTIGMVAAVEEVITVAEQAKLTGIVTHMKASGPARGARRVRPSNGSRRRAPAASASSPISIPTRRVGPALPARSCHDGRRSSAMRR